MSNRIPDELTSARKSAEQEKPPVPGEATTKRTLLVGCAVALVGLPLLMFLISAVVGLITGNLYFFDKRGKTIHGSTARIVSAVILILAALVVLVILRTRKKSRDQKP